MKNISITILLLFYFCIVTNAQSDKLTENITWEITDSKMTILYDLLSPDGKERTYDLEVSIDLGDQIVTPKKGISGINKQKAGKQRKITWYYPASGKTQRELDIPELNVKIKAINPNPPLQTSSVGTTTTPITTANPKLPSLALPAIVTGAGVGLAVYGLILEGDASSMYDEYKADKVDSAVRDQLYEDADSKHIQAQIMGIGGGLLAATGVFLISRTMKKRKAAQNKFSIIPPPSDGYIGANIGVGIQYRF